MTLSTPETIRTLQRKLYTKAKQTPRGVSACFGMKNIGKPCTGEPYARFDEGGQANRAMCWLVRHRQTKEAEQISQRYGLGNLLSTLPEVGDLTPKLTFDHFIFVVISNDT